MMNIANTISEHYTTIRGITDLVVADETIYNHIGYAAGLATIIAFALQTIRILRNKNVSGLSSYMYTMYCLSLICWFSYGIFINSWILAIANLITFLFTFAILSLILYYDEEDKIERYRRDPLTGVFNQKYFEESVPVQIKQLADAGQSYSVAVGKIANLEEVFDKFGGKYKNKALKQVAKTLDKALRDSDFVARTEDNLFLLYLSNTDNKIVQKVFERILASLDKIEISNNGSSVTIKTLWGATSSNKEIELVDLEDQASQALAKLSPQKSKKLEIYKPEKKTTPEAKTKTTKKEKTVKEATKETKTARPKKTAVNKETKEQPATKEKLVVTTSVTEEAPVAQVKENKKEKTVVETGKTEKEIPGSSQPKNQKTKK